MTVRDRILAACCGDEETADLVADLLNRRHPPARPTFPGQGDMAVPPVEQECGRCRQPVDEAGYCSACSHQNPVINRRSGPVSAESRPERQQGDDSE